MNLASIQRIEKVRKHPNADSLSICNVLGWQVITKLDEYREGDLVSYINIDTILPEKPEFEFLRDKKFRIKTIRLRGEISQGLILPVPSGKWNIGDNVTEILGIKKYEKDQPIIIQKPRVPKVWYKKWIYLFKYNVLYKTFPNLRPKLRSKFPKNLVPITDEERIQNIPQVLEQYKGKKFVVSYKLDGSSITIIHHKLLGKSKFRICSRRFELHDKRNDWYKVFKSTFFDKEVLKLVKYYKTNDIIVQGEAVGTFNGNYHNLSKNEIRLFNIYVNGKRLDQSEFIYVCTFLNIPHCPLYKTITLDHTMEEILKISDIKDALNPKVPVEGLVWRCVDNSLSFKVINNQYLLKEK